MQTFLSKKFCWLLVNKEVFKSLCIVKIFTMVNLFCCCCEGLLYVCSSRHHQQSSEVREEEGRGKKKPNWQADSITLFVWPQKASFCWCLWRGWKRKRRRRRKNLSFLPSLAAIVRKKEELLLLSCLVPCQGLPLATSWQASSAPPSRLKLTLAQRRKCRSLKNGPKPQQLLKKWVYESIFAPPKY